MIKIRLHIAWTLVFLVAALLGFSQNIPAVKATVDRNRILIGEPILLTLESTSPAGATVNWFAQDSIPHFEFIEKGKIDSAEKPDGVVFRQHLVITSFDSGSRVIPPLQAVIGNKTYYTDSIHIEVDFSKSDPNQDYHDIKDIIEVENPNVKFVLWSVIALTLISIAMVVYLLRKKEKSAAPVQRRATVALTPYEEAVRALEELKKQKLPESGQTKLYYTRMNDILRLFVLKKLRIASMEKTNEELILQLRDLNISNDQFYRLTEALRMSDYVKFAKYLPGPEDNEKNMAVIESSVQLLNEIEK